jgi:hypothetical protein
VTVIWFGENPVRPKSLRTRGVFILYMESDCRRRSAPKAFRTNNSWLR